MAALRHIVVVGAGVAGLASSIACAAAGARVDLFEVRVAAPPLPAHVDIVPNLLRDLARLGVADACVREGFAYNGLAVVDEHGTRHFDLPTPRLAGERLPRALGITYDRLLAALDDAARRAGVQMHFGRGVLAVDPHNAAVALNDGTQRGADLIVLATGAGAPLVRQLFDVSGAGDASHGWWYALMPRPHGLDQATLMIGARGRRLLLVPTGMAEAGIAILRSRDLDHGTEGAPMAAILSAWGEFPRRLAALLPAHAATVVRANDRALLAPPWHRGAVLCVGAAAHGIVPAFGQSCAQVVEDAVVLGELIGGGLERDIVLARFMERRGERARRVYALSSRAADWIARPEPATDLMALADELDAIVAQPA